MTDEALVAAVADGDMSALRELYTRHGAWRNTHLHCASSGMSGQCGVADRLADRLLIRFMRQIWPDANADQNKVQKATDPQVCTGPDLPKAIFSRTLKTRAPVATSAMNSQPWVLNADGRSLATTGAYLG